MAWDSARDSVPKPTVVQAVFAAWILYLVWLAVSRLYLSPLAKFPGPKLAALSRWYEAYYEIIKGGQYTFKIDQLHDAYGMLSAAS